MNENEHTGRLWLVIEDADGGGTTILSGHATQHDADNESRALRHTYVDYIDLPMSVINALKIN